MARADAVVWVVLAAAWFVANAAALTLYCAAVWRRSASAGGRALSVERSASGKDGYLVVEHGGSDAAKEAAPLLEQEGGGDGEATVVGAV